MNNETTYTIKTTSGVTDFFEAVSPVDAYKQAYEYYDDVETVRESFYGEWECGSKCGYENDGRHYRLDDNGNKDYTPRDRKSENQKFS